MSASRIKPILEPKFKCCECDQLHDIEDDALECCAPEIKEIYLCPVCDDEHTRESEAIACCGFDPDGPPPPPSAAELEAAGQMRLLP